MSGADHPTFVDGAALPCSAILGVHAELRHILPAGWSMERRSEDFVLRTCTDDWRAAVVDMWTVMQFVAYGDFVQLRRDRAAVGMRRYALRSASARGLCFRVWFEIRPAADAEGR